MEKKDTKGKCKIIIGDPYGRYNDNGRSKRTIAHPIESKRIKFIKPGKFNECNDILNEDLITFLIFPALLQEKENELKQRNMRFT